jgi:hypothetical protein
VSCRSDFVAFAWQRGFYEHVIRNDKELSGIRRYVRDNPLKWALDRDDPANMRRLPQPATMADYLREVFT